MSQNRPGHAVDTDAQQALITDLDDVAEHVAYEFDPDKYNGISTIGFAHIHGINGNGSFMSRVRLLAKSVSTIVTEEPRSSGYTIEVGGLKLNVSKAHDGGYRMSVLNVKYFKGGPEFQRLDVRERLNRLVLNRLQYHGYCENAFIRSRMD